MSNEGLNEETSYQDQENSECNITNDDLDQIAALVDTIKEIYSEVDPETQDAVSQEIDSNIQAIMIDLGNKQSPDLSQEISAVYNLNAKFAFYNICFSKAFELLQRIDPKLSSVFSSVQDVNVYTISRFTEKLLTLHPTLSDLVQRLEDQENEKSVLETKNMELENKVAYLEQNANIPQNKKSNDNSAVAPPNWLQEKNEILDELNDIKADNDKYMEKILKQTKEIESLKCNEIKSSMKNSSQNKHNLEAPKTKSKKFKESPEKNKYGSEYSNEANLQDWDGQLHNLGKTSNRFITLKQLKDLIEEICNSKKKHDVKCVEMKIERETMEQHMYTVLNHKFGLRPIVIEWAVSITNGLAKYWKEDNDVAVFAMLMRNECDEEFRNIQKQVRSTIKELFKTTLKSKFPRKRNAEINQIMETKFSGYIGDDECKEILEYIYNDEDYKQILEKLNDHFEDENQTIKNQGRLTREELTQIEQSKIRKIKYSIFEKIILDFQLKSHHNFQMKFIGLFRMYDQNNYGHISELQFNDMMNKVDPECTIDRSKLLKQLDPNAHDVITFTQCVSVFSSEPFGDEADNQTTILQHISTQS